MSQLMHPPTARPARRRSKLEPCRPARGGSTTVTDGLREASMATDERYNLVLAFARVLFINGQATEQTVAATERLGCRLGLRVQLMPRWGELRLQSDDTSIDVVTQLAADPTGVDMDRVVSVMRLI